MISISQTVQDASMDKKKKEKGKKKETTSMKFNIQMLCYKLEY